MASSNTGQNNFPPNIQAALQQAASEVPRYQARGRGHWHHRGQRGGRHHPSGNGRGQGHSRGAYNQAQLLPQNPQYAQPQAFSQQVHDFPALTQNGNHQPTESISVTNMPASRAAVMPPPGLHTPINSEPSQSGMSTSNLAPQQQQPPPNNAPQQAQIDGAGSFAQNAATGVYRGRGSAGRSSRSRGGPHSMAHQYQNAQNPRGNTHGQARLFHPHAAHGSYNRLDVSPREKFIIQSSYLTDVANRELQKSISALDLKANENFRRKLERILQEMIKEWAKDNVTVNPSHVKLRCYGSMANGFAVPGSDMDLLLMFPQDEGPIGSIETECRRMFEKRLLEEGIGARLLTKTRVPILRVCEDPGHDLLDDLRAYRVKSMEQDREDDVEKRMKKMGLKASRLPVGPSPEVTKPEPNLDIPTGIPLPPSPVNENLTIDFSKTSGIQCDINFSNYVAIHNTNLLKSYCICDDRVRQLGLVVKAWVKARKINTPYYGTLSSYGYILMVLHFLINVANPPVIPNLQTWVKRDDDSKNPKDIPLFEGFDVRFMGDEATLRRIAAEGRLTRNTEPLGSLLRSFFQYYADPRGFHYSQEVISIRTQGGILRKGSKGWTEAKRTGADGSIRLRYLLCIEDPFEIEHNIARTVGHSGIVSIRDEFRRAWDIVNRIEFVQGTGWQWQKINGTFGEDLFAEAEDRGDLLKKDAEFARERAQERKLAEAEKSAAELATKTAADKTVDKHIEDTHRMEKTMTAAASPDEQGTIKNGVAPISTTSADSESLDSNAQVAKQKVTDGQAKSGGKGSKPPHWRERRRLKALALTAQKERKQCDVDDKPSPSTESTITATSICTPISRMPTPPLSSLTFPFDPNQLRDLQLNVEGRNGCARGPRGYDYEGIFGEKAAFTVEEVDNFSDVANVDCSVEGDEDRE